MKRYILILICALGALISNEKSNEISCVGVSYDEIASSESSVSSGIHSSECNLPRQGNTYSAPVRHHNQLRRNAQQTLSHPSFYKDGRFCCSIYNNLEILISPHFATGFAKRSHRLFSLMKLRN